jgi:hypothetical protein
MNSPESPLRPSSRDLPRNRPYRNCSNVSGNESKPGYRALLTALAACGCTDMDIYSDAGRPSYEQLKEFLTAVQIVLDQRRADFVDYYRYAFKSVALEAMEGDKSRDAVLQEMQSRLRTSNFSRLLMRMELMRT